MFTHYAGLAATKVLFIFANQKVNECLVISPESYINLHQSFVECLALGSTIQAGMQENFPQAVSSHFKASS